MPDAWPGFGRPGSSHGRALNLGVTADTARSVAIGVWTPSRSRVRVSRDDDETKPSRLGREGEGDAPVFAGKAITG